MGKSISIEVAPGIARHLLTPTETGEYLGIPATTLAQWRSSGRRKLAYVKIGHHVRYRREDLDQFIAANTHCAA